MLAHEKHGFSIVGYMITTPHKYITVDERKEVAEAVATDILVRCGGKHLAKGENVIYFNTANKLEQG